MELKVNSLTTEEKEEVVMQYFGMERRDELATLVRAMMRKIKNEYEEKIKEELTMLSSLNVDRLDTKRMRGQLHELNELSDLLVKHEYMEKLYKSINAHIERPDALP